MTISLSKVLSELHKLGLENVTVGQESDGEIVLYTSAKLDDEGNSLVPFNEFDDDPE